jgi:hypothetical protein
VPGSVRAAPGLTSSFTDGLALAALDAGFDSWLHRKAELNTLLQKNPLYAADLQAAIPSTHEVDSFFKGGLKQAGKIPYLGPTCLKSLSESPMRIDLRLCDPNDAEASLSSHLHPGNNPY